MDHATARILIVDDEPSITEFVSYAMQKEGYETDVASDGETALKMLEEKHYDLFVLDIMLPGIDGYDLCRRIRAKMDTPILFLSARDSELNKVVGLELGADDYLAKPFGVRELMARTRALLRRSQPNDSLSSASEICAGGITLDKDAHTANGSKGPIDLTPREFELLACLMRNAGKVVRAKTCSTMLGVGNLLQKLRLLTPTSNAYAIKSKQLDMIPSLLKPSADMGIASKNK